MRYWWVVFRVFVARRTGSWYPLFLYYALYRFTTRSPRKSVLLHSIPVPALHAPVCFNTYTAMYF